MEEYIVIQNVETVREWPKLFEAALHACDSFQIMYPDGEWDEENPLLAGKLDFEKLEGIRYSSWDGMKGSTVFSGKLDDNARKIFWHHMAPGFEGYSESLWNFDFYRKGLLFLSIQDFSVCLIYSYPEVIEFLEQQGIDIFNLE